MIAAGSAARATGKPRKCKAKGCGKPFTPAKPLQSVCGPLCAITLAKDKREASASKEAAHDRRSTRDRLSDLKPMSYWCSKAQKAVNRYVRARDRDQGCISCDLPSGWDGQWHASHLRSVAAASSIRFNLWNIHKACWICNNIYSGRIDAYKPKAIEKIGADRFEWIFEQNQKTKYTRQYLERLAALFNKKAARKERSNELLR